MFQKGFYEKKYPIFANFIRRHKTLNIAFKMIYYGMPVIMIIIYIMFLIKVYKDHGSKALKKALIIPGIAFVGVSLFRKFYNRKRPYEKYDYRPLIVRKKKGSSLPSRHTFSAGVIAAAVSVYYPILAPFMWLMTGVIAFSRFLAGVHYAWDILLALIMAAGVRISMSFVKS